MRNRVLALENAINIEQTKREIAETREASLQQKLAEEIAAHKVSLFEKDAAIASVEPLTSAVDGLREGKRFAESSVFAVERKIQGVLSSLDELEKRTKEILQPGSKSIWKRLPAYVLSVLAGCLMFGVLYPSRRRHPSSWGRSQSHSLVPSLRYPKVDMGGVNTITELRSEIKVLNAKLDALSSLKSRNKELEAENIELAKKLQVAQGLADVNWIDAALALKAARAKANPEPTEGANKQ
jgi:hypothetical protein